MNDAMTVSEDEWVRRAVSLARLNAARRGWSWKDYLAELDKCLAAALG